MVGGSVTWSNGTSASRIDCFLVSGYWEEHFSNALQSRLGRSVSDHWPVLLECGGVWRGPSPSRFENMWLKVEGFVDMVRGWWESYQVLGSPSCMLAHKLKLLKIDLKRWNKETFGQLKSRKEAALAIISEIDLCEEAEEGLNDEEVSRR